MDTSPVFEIIDDRGLSIPQDSTRQQRRRQRSLGGRSTPRPVDAGQIKPRVQRRDDILLIEEAVPRRRASNRSSWRPIPISFLPSRGLTGKVFCRNLYRDEVELVEVEIFVRVASLKRCGPPL